MGLGKRQVFHCLMWVEVAANCSQQSLDRCWLRCSVAYYKEHFEQEKDHMLQLLPRCSQEAAVLCELQMPSWWALVLNWVEVDKNPLDEY